MVLKHGIAIATFGWLKSDIIFKRRLTSSKSLILSLAPSDKYESAQQISVIISSLSFSTKTLIKVGIALLTSLYYGCGLPLHRLDKAHDAFLIKEVPATA